MTTDSGDMSAILDTGKDDVDDPDDNKEWLSEEPAARNEPLTMNYIDALPVAFDSTHISAALSLDRPSTESSKVSLPLSGNIERIPEGNDNNFLPKFGF
jgi:hypothetical protein